MPNISISNLNPTGSDLFIDDESFMSDLTEQELNNISGGFYGIDQEFQTRTSIGSPVVSQSPVQTIAVQTVSKVASVQAYGH